MTTANHKGDIAVASSDAARSHSGSSIKNGAVLGVLETVPSDNLRRHLTSRQIQILAIGGTVGGAVFIALGGALANGGPGSLFLAYCIQIIFMGMVTNCEAEMTSFMPVPAAFIQHATKWVDEAYGFMVGWNCTVISDSCVLIYMDYLWLIRPFVDQIIYTWHWGFPSRW